jgi:DNA-binding XRE family transcriptional regulator/tetratricopeptide (TPR) repeat protein
VPGKRRALAERRRVVGYTQEQFAEVLGVERTTVVRWEAGETTPQPWCRPKLAKALVVSVDELDTMLAEGQTVEHGRSPSSSASHANGQQCDVDAAEESQNDLEYDPVLVAPWNHRGTVDVVVMVSGGDWVKRRVFLALTGPSLTAPAHQWLVREPEPLISGLSGRRISADMVRQLTAMIAELRKMDDIAGGGGVLSLAQHEFSWAAGLLNQAVYDERTGKMLFIALAELGQLCGWAAYDAGLHALAQRYYVAALRATHSAADRVLGAHVLSCMAEQAARQGQPAEAVTLIETALAGIQGREIPSLLVELYGRQAYAFATLGDVSGCNAAISKVRTQIERLTPGAGPSWLYWVNPANMTSETGNALRQLGYAEQAAAVLENGIAMFDDSLPRGRHGYLIALADVRARPGKQCDLDLAASYGMEAIQLAENLDSSRCAGQIRNLYYQMRPHAKVSAVGHFLERARDLVAV